MTEDDITKKLEELYIYKFTVEQIFLYRHNTLKIESIIKLLNNRLIEINNHYERLENEE